MSLKITVNGVAYDSVEAMPAEVRRTYEAMLAKFPDLATGAAGAAPEVTEGDVGPLHITTTVRRKFVVNGQAYESEASMPPEARQAYDVAASAARNGEPNPRRNEIRVSFQLTGPGFKFGNGVGGAGKPGQIVDPVAIARPSGGMPKPIEPSVGPFRVALLFAGGVALAALFWLFVMSAWR